MKPIYQNPLPSGWLEQPLGQLVKLQRGYTWEKEQETDHPEEGTVPVVRIPNIREELDLSNLLYLRGVSQSDIEKTAVTKNWIIMVGSNGTQDRIGDSVLIEEDRPMVFASFLLAMTPIDENTLTPEYLSLWMRLHNVHELFSKTSQQTTGLANLSWGAVKRLPVRFPADVKKQHQITEIINTINKAVSKAQVELDKTVQLHTALVQQLFLRGIPGRHTNYKSTKIGEIPATWDPIEIRKLWGGSTNGLYVPEEKYGKGIPIVRIDAFGDGYFHTKEFKRIRITEDEAKPFLVQDGDLLFNRVNSIPFLGKVVYVDKLEEPTVFESNMMRLRFEDTELAEYLALYLSTGPVKRRIWSMGRPAVQQLSINQRDIGTFLVALPEPEERREILGLVRNMREAILKKEKACNQLITVKKSILRDMLNGKFEKVLEGAVSV